MKILIRSAKIFCKDSPHHLKTKNVLINNGNIAGISNTNYAADKVIEGANCILSAGWVDLGAHVGDPGFEYREDLNSLNKAAAAGGFTDVAVLPNTNPVVQTKNEVAYLMRNNPDRLVQVWPMAAVTKDCLGEELTEMIDLHHAGSVAFTDGLKPLWHTDIFLKALQYIQPFNGLLVDHSEDVWLNMFGQMNEGSTATRLGLKGMPSIAEESSISRNLELLEYADGRLHFSKISTSGSVDRIKLAKKKGLNVTCCVTAYQVLMDDQLLKQFDTNYKLNPPLRDQKNNDLLLKALKGTIDVICSGHMPLEPEEKQVEFEQAGFGLINWQTFGTQLTQLSDSVPWEDLIEKVTTNPRRILKLPKVSIAVGQKANLTLFDPNKAWALDETTNLSRSMNSPWWKVPLKGKVSAVFNNGRELTF